MTIVDYEFAAKVGALKSDWIFMPHYIPSDSPQQAKKQVMKYPGLKEDVYVPRFRPDPSLRAELGLTEEDLVVTVRPPATEAHYHNEEAEGLLEAALDLLMERPGSARDPASAQRKASQSPGERTGPNGSRTARSSFLNTSLTA